MMASMAARGDPIEFERGVIVGVHLAGASVTDSSACWCFTNNGVKGDVGMELRVKNISKDQEWAEMHTPGSWYPRINLKSKAKQVSNCRSIDCKFQPGVQAASFIKNSLLRTPQSTIPYWGCSALTAHHICCLSPVVQIAQEMDDRAVEKCDMVKVIILHHMCTCGANLKNSKTLSAWFQQWRFLVVL